MWCPATSWAPTAPSSPNTLAFKPSSLFLPPLSSSSSWWHPPHLVVINPPPCYHCHHHHFPYRPCLEEGINTAILSSWMVWMVDGHLFSPLSLYIIALLWRTWAPPSFHLISVMDWVVFRIQWSKKEGRRGEMNFVLFVMKGEEKEALLEEQHIVNKILFGFA